MTKNLRLILIFSLSIFGFGSLHAQAPEQDCINAIPVCQNVYVQSNSYADEGLNPNEINFNTSCLESGEQNDVWYIFTVQIGGMLNFTIFPNNTANDYDWAVYDLTNNTCSDIATTPSLEVSCNYASRPGATGPNLIGGANSNGAGGSNRNAPIPVTAGQTFVVNVSNFSGTTAGYTLDFSASTAAIFDNIPPEMDSIADDCTGSGLIINFSENVICATVEPTDFSVTGPGGPYTVTSVTGANCTAGGTFENEYIITVAPPMAASGRYYVSLQGDVEDNCGNIGIYVTDSVDRVAANIVPTATQATLCLGQSTTLSTPSQPGFSYVWSGGNIGATVNITPPLTAVYTVFVTDPFGCVYTDAIPITVIDTPLASFSINPLTTCANDPVDILFTGLSDPGAIFTWDFGGGTVISGTGAGPYQISWPTGGINSVSLGIDQQGCTSASIATNVTVNSIPTSDFTLPNDPQCLGTNTTISYAGSPSLSATYFWDFDGGIVVSGIGAGPYEVTWPTPGPKNISLTVTDNACTSATTNKTYNVVGNPVASITPVADQCFKGNSFSFLYNGGSAITSYDWDFGDGSPNSTQENPNHSYNNSGNYIANLNITDANGCASTSSINLEVFPAMQTDFTFSSVCSGLNTDFTDISNTNGIAIQSWNWDFGNGNSSTLQNPSESYTGFGFFNTQLILTTVQGCKDTINQQVEVYEQPTVGFTFVDACENLPVSFEESSTVINSSLNYSWDFGDGSNSTLANPAHIYNGFGTFPVSLTITTPQGCTDQTTNNITVFPKPVANIQVDAVCHENPSIFQSTSTVPGGGSINRYSWDFGNGGTSNDLEPSYTYDIPGLYDTRLIIATGNNCLDTASISATVYPNPVPAFSSSSVCEQDSAFFTSLSTIDGSITADLIDEYSWNFGDNSSGSSLENPGHIYNQDGTYTVTLTTTSNKGCVASISNPFLIYPGPDAPNAIEDTSCFGFPAFLIAQPQPGQDVDHVDWFMQASGGSQFETSFTFVTPPLTSTQTYFLEAVSSFGCRSPRVEINAYTHDESLGELAVKDSVLEIPQAIGEFAILGGSPITSYAWNFGDGNTSTDPNPIHEYKNAGKYRVIVTFVTENGCEGQFSKLIEVKELIVVSIPSAFSPNGDGVNDFFYIGNNLMTDLDFKVYNRWGELVFQSQNMDFKWDGFSPSGKRLAEGVYIYFFDGIDIQGRSVERTGTISLFK